MAVLLRASRIRDPRSSLASSVLLFVAFSLFGVWIEAGAALETNAQASILSPEQGFVHCPSRPEVAAAWPAIVDPWTAPTMSAQRAIASAPSNVC